MERAPLVVRPGTLGRCLTKHQQAGTFDCQVGVPRKDDPTFRNSLVPGRPQINSSLPVRALPCGGAPSPPVEQFVLVVSERDTSG